MLITCVFVFGGFSHLLGGCGGWGGEAGGKTATTSSQSVTCMICQCRGRLN